MPERYFEPKPESSAWSGAAFRHDPRLTRRTALAKGAGEQPLVMSEFGRAASISVRGVEDCDS